MTFVDFSPEDVDALTAARATLVVCRDFAHAYQVDELLQRMRAARQDEIAVAVIDELTERRGVLRVVET